MLKRVRGWVGALDQRSTDSAWRLCLKLAEPLAMPVIEGVTAPSISTQPSVNWVPGGATIGATGTF